MNLDKIKTILKNTWVETKKAGIYMYKIMINPVKAYKDHKENYNTLKNSLFLTGLISFTAMLISLIVSMVNVVIEPVYDYFELTGHKVELSNLGNLNYLELILGNFITVALVIGFIAFVFYIGSLIVKKETKYIDMLTVSATSVIPVLVAAILVALFAIINANLAVLVFLLLLVYSVNILYELVNLNIKVKPKLKLIFNSVCFFVIIASFYIYAYQSAINLISM